ncbi:exodeoxyribonuclease VII large subunit [Rickettsiales bacterium]|nr:exodeoxyribonuclease VII large subunit [Rickettsiales bacterium]
MYQRIPEKILEYSVSEISSSIKHVIESGFSFVKIRGEISNLKFHQSGHVYFNLKDANSVINSVCFKNVAHSLKIKPEEGLEVVVTGRVTTYSLRSNYQIIVSNIEIGGVGSLMALFEKLKKDLLAKGYFDSKHKKPIPKFPDTLYVITSETGAVIQDIIHRVGARYPLELVVAPVKVQGVGAELEIANRIAEINEIADKSRENTIIIARGGGSIEDLWCFNEELIVKAVFNSEIPIISAIGHETDTTLIDYVADLRAPTPTAAAELATPVRAELQNFLLEKNNRLCLALNKKINESLLKISSLERILNQGSNVIDEKYQRLDDLSDMLQYSIKSKLKLLKLGAETTIKQIRTPKQIFDFYQNKISNYENLLKANTNNKIQACFDKAKYLSPNKNAIKQSIGFKKRQVENVDKKIHDLILQKIDQDKNHINNLAKLLESLSYKNVLARGFSIVRGDTGKIIKQKALLKLNKEIEIEFFDDRVVLQNINLKDI